MPGVLRPIFPAFGIDDFDPLNPAMWEEEVGDHGKRTDVITHGESLCTLRGFVLDHALVLPALTYWLGYSWVDSTDPGNPKLRRKLPAPHPESTQLFANRVQVSGWKYKDKVKLPNPAALGPRVPFARYVKYYFEIDFGMVDYAVLPDNHIRFDGVPINEWDRFVSINPSDDTEILTVDGGNFVYKDGATPANPVTINGPLIRRNVERTELVIRARQLPYDFLFDDFNIPRKLMRCKGKVNKDLFLNFNKHTMLLQSWQPVKYPQPVATQTWTVLQFGVDVEFRFSYQEPTKAIDTEPLGGWNLVPKISPRWEDGWYGIQTAVGNRPLYSEINMKNVLTHWRIDNLNDP